MAEKTESPVSVEQIDGVIRTIRGVRVMLDRDLAQIYGVPRFVSTKRSNEIGIDFRPISCSSLRVGSSIL